MFRHGFRSRLLLFVVIAVLLNACGDKQERDEADKRSPNAETLKRIVEIKASTLQIAEGLASLEKLPPEKAREILRRAQDKGFPAMIRDLEFLDRNLSSSDPDRAAVARYLKAMKSAHSRVEK
jgi:hypothetical protein